MAVFLFVKNNQEKLITDHVKTLLPVTLSEGINIYLLNMIRKEEFIMAEKRCYTVKDLQEMLDVSRSTVYKLLRQNEFRWIQLEGGGYRISKKSFDEWLDKGNASVTS